MAVAAGSGGGLAPPPHPYGAPGRCVLHVDVDAFFCQVEVLRHPELRGVPLAIQQHQDVISVNYEARQAGVKKHMLPAKARELLSAAGGRLWHVFTERDGRVSYRPYREASAALLRLLRGGLPAREAAAVRVVEKASIDEAFVEVVLPSGGVQGGEYAVEGSGERLQGPPAAGAADMPAWVAASGGARWDLSAAAGVAAAVRAAARQRLGLTVSVGVAPNKLLAKLASRAAKPNGLLALDGVQAVQRLLADATVDRLPGLGGAVASALRQRGLTHVAQLQGQAPAALAALLGGQQHLKLAARLAEAAWGLDPSPVVDRGPPKSLQVQMSLTPLIRPLPPDMRAAGQAPAGQPAQQQPALMPLLVRAADTAPRLAAVLGAMTGDLLSRVLLDRYEEDRWPQKLAVTVSTLTAGQQQPRNASRSAAFPTPALLTVPQPQLEQVADGGHGGGSGGAAVADDGTAGTAGRPAPHANAGGAAAEGAAFCAPGVVAERSFSVGSQLHQAVVASAVGLAQAAVATVPADHTVVQLNVAVSQFCPFEAACMGSIRRFVATAPPVQPGNPAKQQEQQQQQQPGAGRAAPVAVQAAPAALAGGGGQASRSGGAATALAASRPAQRPLQQQPLAQQAQLAFTSVPAARPPAVAPGPTSSAGAAERGQPDPRAMAQPPVLLSDLAAHLAAVGTTAEAAEAQLERLLAAAGARRLLPLPP